jgi:hypothetical protein
VRSHLRLRSARPRSLWLSRRASATQWGSSMECRQLGCSGVRVSVLTLGTMACGCKGVFAKTGETDPAGARRLADRCIAAGIDLFDTPTLTLGRGAFSIGVLLNGLVPNNVSSHVQQIIIGVIIVLAVASDTFAKSRRRRA